MKRNWYECVDVKRSKLSVMMETPEYRAWIAELKKDYDERQLKLAMVANIERALLEIGRGFAFVGREYPMMIGGQEKRADLLFYLIPQHRYFVVEVKMGEFEPADLGQLEGYLASCDLELNGEGDDPAFGLVVCKGRNETLVRYMLGKKNMPIGVSEYELLRCLPEEFKSDMPTTDELESEFNLADEHSSRSGYDVAKGPRNFPSCSFARKAIVLSFTCGLLLSFVFDTLYCTGKQSEKTTLLFMLWRFGNREARRRGGRAFFANRRS